MEINVYKVISAERAEPIVKAIEGKTFMNFYVNVCPYQGEFHVNVGTLRTDTTEKELTEMVLHLLCGDLAFKKPAEFQ